MDRTRSSKALANPEYSSLTDKEDLLGCALLDMLSRGAALIAEIHRLGDRLPREARSEQDYLFSFEDYFRDPERNETRLNRSASSVQADEEFQSKHYEFLERFFNVCAGIVRLAGDFNRVTRDLRRGFFLSHSLEQALLDPDGKQWIPECMHLVGASLLLLNERFPGKSRERLIVAQYRMRGEASLKDFDQVVALVRDVEVATKGSTSSSTTNTISPSEQLLARLNIDGRLARAIVSRIQADDIYGHTRAWPLTEHRSTALANQASIIYTALLFTEAGLKSKKSASDILPLSNGRAEMREIIDKHFSDQWVVVICTGYIVDLEQEWSYYPAARIALADVVSRMPTLRSFNKTQAKRVQSLLDEYLTRGVLTERYVTDHWDSLLEVLREANVTLRWRFLHGKTKAWSSAMSTSSTTNSSSSSSASAQTKEGLSAADTIRLLLATAQLEHVLREAVRRVLDSKDLTWKTCRERVSERMKELAQYFSGQVPLAKVQKDEELMKWFQGLGEEVAHLQYQKTPTATGRRVQALIKALEEVEKFDGVDASLQVREFLSDSRSLLEKMVRTVNVREEILVQIDVVSDLSYAWGKALEEYDLVWHDRVRQDPSSVGLLRAVFLKLTSVLDSALSRVAQAGSPDVDSVAEYWSRRLVAYVKRVLEIVPQSVCAVLDSVGEALEKIPDEGISRYQLNELGTLAAGEARYELAKCTHKIAVFTGGVLTMGRCVLGVVEVDPKRVLEDGLRQELRRRMLLLINQYSPSATNTDSSAWRSQLTIKAQEMKRLKRAFEYVQDYLTLDGTRTWNEELAKVVSIETPYLREVLLKQLSFVDWTNERSYFALLDDLLNLIGVSGLVCLEALIGLEMHNLTLEYTKNSRNCELALSQLNLPAGVVWGSHNWVDSVREARRRYPSDQMETDFKRLARIGGYFLTRSRIRFYLEKEAKRDAPLLSLCVGNLSTTSVDNSETNQAQIFHLLSVSLGITVPIPSVPQNSLEDVSVVRRTFILMNELTKRIVSDNLANGVFSNLDFFYCCAGVASFCHAKLFVQELERCVFASARALCQKSLMERQSAESAIVFKFGAQKVAKVAMERLVTEQSVHRLIANLAKMPPDSALKRAPLFIERIGEMWCGK